MSEEDFAVMAFLLAAACLAAAVVGRRIGNDARDVHALAGSAAALGGVGLVLLA